MASNYRVWPTFKKSVVCTKRREYTAIYQRYIFHLVFDIATLNVHLIAVMIEIYGFPLAYNTTVV